MIKCLDSRKWRLWMHLLNDFWVHKWKQQLMKLPYILWAKTHTYNHYSCLSVFLYRLHPHLIWIFYKNNSFLHGSLWTCYEFLYIEPLPVMHVYALPFCNVVTSGKLGIFLSFVHTADKFDFVLKPFTLVFARYKIHFSDSVINVCCLGCYSNDVREDCLMQLRAAVNVEKQNAKLKIWLLLMFVMTLLWCWTHEAHERMEAIYRIHAYTVSKTTHSLTFHNTVLSFTAVFTT